MDLLVRQAVRDWSSGLRLACPLGMPGLTVRYLRTSEAKTRGHLHKRALQEDSVSGRGQRNTKRGRQEEESRARLTITVKSSSCSCRRSGLPGRCSWRMALDFVRLAPARTRLRPGASACSSPRGTGLLCTMRNGNAPDQQTNPKHMCPETAGVGNS